MDEDRIKLLAEDLKNQDVSKRESAARELGNAAKTGQDITSAITALENALNDNSIREGKVEEFEAFIYEHRKKDMSKQTAAALTHHYLNKEKWGKIDELLVHENADAREGTADVLSFVAIRGRDITQAIPALANALSDKNCSVRGNATWALRGAAEKDQDITPAVSALGNALNDNRIRESKVQALIYEYGKKEMSQKNLDKLRKLRQLAYENRNFKLHIVEILDTAAEKGQNIAPAVPALGKALEDLGQKVRQHAFLALIHHYLNKKNWEGIGELLLHGDINVRWDACWALDTVAEKGHDITPSVPALGNALWSVDSSVRRHAVRMLETIAKKGHDITPAVLALGNALGNEDRDFELRVIKILETAAEKGQDITPAIPALEKALGEEKLYWHACWALTYHYINKKEGEGIEELLGHKNTDVRRSTSSALKTIAETGRDITPAVPALGKALEDVNLGVGCEAVYMLKTIAETGRDITPTIPALINALGDEDNYIYTGWPASLALIHHYRNKENWKGIEELLVHENADVRKGTAREIGVITHCIQDIIPAVSALEKELGDGDSVVGMRALWALVYAAFSDQDITPAIPALEKALGEENRGVKRCASLALTHHHTTKENWKGIEELLVHENAEVREDAVEALDKFVKKCDSVEKLDACQTIIKKYIENQPRGKTIEEVETEVKISGLLASIAKKKAELLRQQGGELLLGETVKKPKDKDKKMYRSLKKTTCS